MPGFGVGIKQVYGLYRQQWSFTGASSAIADIAGNGSGAQTVSIANGGAGADGTVVVAINGSTYTITNNNTNPINFVAGTGSANIGAQSTASFTGSGTTWSYAGKAPTENSDNDPFADQEKLERLEKEIFHCYELWEDLEGLNS